MSRPIVARATSLAASTGLLALAIAGALSISYVVKTAMPPPDADPVTSSLEPPPYVPPVTHPKTPPQTPRTIIKHDASPTTTPDTSTSPTQSESFAPPTEPSSPTITNPRWQQTPRDLARYYPRRAQQMAIKGSATLDCLVDLTGRLGCSVVAESPAGWNFGAAALRISRDYRMSPALLDGQPRTSALSHARPVRNSATLKAASSLC